jgi:hypothetical protein
MVYGTTTSSPINLMDQHKMSLQRAQVGSLPQSFPPLSSPTPSSKKHASPKLGKEIEGRKKIAKLQRSYVELQVQDDGKFCGCILHSCPRFLLAVVEIGGW